ncbi:ATP-binding cassette domain-containing protein [Ethanoligenens sp.]|uniref:ABC transporter ATP-binding protein n=1 Tax=Ethanoligenens sp. TaxID=2099655 RepID=UPI0039EB2181
MNRLVIQEMKKAFGEKQVLKKVDFTFEQGKIYGLLGRNGAGKTTLFNCLSGDLAPDGGTVMLEQDGQRRPLTPEDIGYVFATPILPEFLTGYEFLKFYMEIQAAHIKTTNTIDDYFDLIKIEREDRNRLIKEYSHGMKNKLQMLLFLIARPPVILLDEPLTSFDVVVALEIKKLLRAIRSKHILIFSTHILQLATDLCDEVVVLHEGSLSSIDEATLHSNTFEAKILDMLKDEKDV